MTARRRRVLVAVLGLLAVAGAVVAGLALRGDDPVVSRAAPTAAPVTTPPADPAWVPTGAERAEAERLAAGLDVEELAGQLIVARHFDEESSLALVRERHFAGVMVTSPQILDVATADPLAQVTGFNDRLHEAGRERKVPVLVPIDQEGGLVARLGDPLTTFPGFMTAGAATAGDAEAGADAVRAAALGSGRELRDAGYNAVFAPVGDLTIGADDPIIGSRSPGSRPEPAAAAVVAAVRGYADAGLISSVKHFPGHNVDEDSHKGLPRLDRTRAELAERDLVPFRAAAEAQAPSIMTGHLDVPALDEGVPASLSREVVTGLLREELGYEGVIISDSLGMGAVMQRHPGGEAAVEALRAGSDLALMPADNVAAHEAVVEAIEDGTLPEAQARASAARVLAWLLHQEATPGQDAAPGSQADAAEQLSAAGLTVVTRDCDQDFAVRSVTPVGDPAAVQRFTRAARDGGLTIGGGTVVSFAGPGGGVVPGTVVVATDTPYVLARTDAPYRIALYGSGEPAMRALVEVLAGREEARGALPVDVEGLEPTTC